MNKLCPFRFSKPDEGSLGGMCIGVLCALYSDKRKTCSLADDPATPTPKPTRKKTEAKTA